jgi:hypothetical protein
MYTFSLLLRGHYFCGVTIGTELCASNQPQAYAFSVRNLQLPHTLAK